jgi:hypothetical protein
MEKPLMSGDWRLNMWLFSEKCHGLQVQFEWWGRSQTILNKTP